MSSPDNIQRSVLPIPDKPRTGLVLYDAKDPENKYPPITPVAAAGRCTQHLARPD